MKSNQGDKPGDGHCGRSDADIVEGLKKLQYFVSVLLSDRHRQHFGVQHIIELDTVIAQFLDMCAQLLGSDGTDASGISLCDKAGQRHFICVVILIVSSLRGCFVS